MWCLKLITLCTCVVWLSSDVVNSKYIYQSDVERSIGQNKVVATWEEAKKRCENTGAILASPIDEKLLKHMLSYIDVNNHTNLYFIGIKAKFNPKPEFYSAEGVLLDDLPEVVLDMIDQLDPREGDCLAMNRDSIRVVPCWNRYPYICYTKLKCNKPEDEETVKPTEVAPTTESTTTDIVPTSLPTEAAPTIESTTTEIVPTSLPTEAAPTTESTTTEIVPTSLPTEAAPTTESTTTEIVPTSSPTEAAPTTESTTTEIVPTSFSTEAAPTTESTTTEIVPTSLPTEAAPTTESTTTEIVPTSSPTEAAPTTESTTTEIVPTSSPTEAAPTTESITTEIVAQTTIGSECDYEGYEYWPATERCYHLHTTEKSWSDANKTCDDEGGYLVIVNDQSEAYTIANIIQETTVSGLEYITIWTGVIFSTENNDWRSIHDDPIDKIHHLGSDFFHSSYAECVLIQWDTSLMDYPCYHRSAFVCEKSL